MDNIAESVKFQLRVRDKLSETHKAVNDLRTIRKQVTDYLSNVQDSTFKKDMETISKPMLEKLQGIEDELIQHKAKAFQDLLALPIKLNDKIAGLASVAASADAKPTSQVQEAYEDLSKQVDAQLTKLAKVISEDIPKFNQKAESFKTSAIKLNGVVKPWFWFEVFF